MEASGRTPREALYRLMNKVGNLDENTPNYGLSFGTQPYWEEYGENMDYYITNVIVSKGDDYIRAVIKKEWSASSRRYYYRAWFGLLLDQAKRGRVCSERERIEARIHAQGKRLCRAQGQDRL